MTRTVTLGCDAGAAAPRAAGPCFEVYDTEFEAVLGRHARLALVAETDAHEGPVYVPGEDALYFTTVPRAPAIPAPGMPQAAIKRLSLDGLSLPVDPSRLSTVPAPAHMPNGMTRGQDGLLVVCEQGTRSAPARISRVDPLTGRVDTLVDNWGGRPLNSPNDVVVRRDGTIWFTDPSYGYLQGFRPEPAASTRHRRRASRCSARPGTSSVRSAWLGRSTSPSAAPGVRCCSSLRTRPSGRPS